MRVRVDRFWLVALGIVAALVVACKDTPYQDVPPGGGHEVPPQTPSPTPTSGGAWLR